MILIGSTYGKELEPLIRHMVIFEQGTIFNRVYVRGVIGRNEIIAFSGISGKVETAFVLQKMIDEFHPGCFFLLSEAKALSPDLKTGDLILGEAYREYDRNTTEHSLAPLIVGITDFVVRLRKEFTDIQSGVIISGDESIREEGAREALYLKHRAIAVDKDSASAAVVCQANGLPFMAIKVIVGSCDTVSDEEYKRAHDSFSQKPADFFATYVENNYLNISVKKEKNG
jgi:adenosylhomocysteine nucleosidase